MDTGSGRDRGDETVTVRYWAGARAAAGTAQDSFAAPAGLTLAQLVAQVLDRHPGERMSRTVAACSVLVGEQPVGTRDPATVDLAPGAVVELLPPFAGG
jgi:sulfur-carrier protein